MTRCSGLADPQPEFRRGRPSCGQPAAYRIVVQLSWVPVPLDYCRRHVLHYLMWRETHSDSIVTAHRLALAPIGDEP